MHIPFRHHLALPAIVLAAALALTAAAGLRMAQPAYALTNCTVSDNTFDSEESAFLTLINNYRAQNGLGALTISTNLNRAATWLAADMATKSYFSHTDSLGRNPSTRAQNCDYPGGAGENIAAGTVKDTAAEAFEMWRNSSGHNANMLNSSYKTIGIARHYVAGSPYGWYWVTDFGLVLDGTGGGATATPTRTATAVPPTATRTATRTATAIPPTTTRTATAVPPTATPTRTATVANPTATRTATRTATVLPPTATPTRTATTIPPTATRTATSVPPTATPTRTTAPTFVKAGVTSPAPGSTLPGSSATFVWTTGSGALEYFVYAGSTQGSNSYFGRSAGLATSISVTNLPANGSTVHVRLWTRFSTGWQVNDYTYRAASAATATPTAKAAMTSPAPGSRLGTSANFAWTAGSGATQYYLYVGSTPGNGNLYASSTGLNRTATVSGLPRDGSTVYVRLWTRLGTTWQYTDYTYLAATR